jgi:hypothetical protein
VRVFAIAACLSLLAPCAFAAIWQDRVTPIDAAKLKRLDAAWNEALTEARREHRSELAALGALVRPDAALTNPTPPAGLYRCRTVKLGGNLPYVAYDWFRCRIERSPRGELTLAKISGSQRSFGVLYPDRAKRAVFLGAVSWGTDETAMAYGAKPDRSQAGVLERIGPKRWRLALPWPEYESRLDLIELRP